jgi:hypothetical protein
VAVWAEVVEVEVSTVLVEVCLREVALEGLLKASQGGSHFNDQMKIRIRISNKINPPLTRSQGVRVKVLISQKLLMILMGPGGYVKHGWVSYWRAFYFLLISWPF